MAPARAPDRWWTGAAGEPDCRLALASVSRDHKHVWLFRFPDFFTAGIAESGNHDQREAEALIKANKDFELRLLPNQNHGYGTASSYVMRRRCDFFVRWLMDADPPKDYLIK